MSGVDLADLHYRLVALFTDHQANGNPDFPACACGARFWGRQPDGASHVLHLTEVLSTWLQREGIVGGPAGG